MWSLWSLSLVIQSNSLTLDSVVMVPSSGLKATPTKAKAMQKCTKQVIIAKLCTLQIFYV